MKLPGFGKNTYQYLISFKIDCISPELVSNIVHDLFITRKQFGSLAKDQTANLGVLTRGDGSQSAPFFQLKFGADRIMVWAGWHTSFEQWQQSRTSTFLLLAPHLRRIPIEVVASLSSEYAFTIPTDKLKPNDEIAELQPTWEFFRRFIPADLLSRVGASLAFGDEEGRETLGWWVSGRRIPGEENITFALVRNVLEGTAGLDQNIMAHAGRSDNLLEAFHSGYLSLLIRS